MCGTLRKRAVYGKTEPFLKVQGPLSFLLPLSIVLVLALTPGLRVLHNGEAVFQTQPVREPPEGKAGAPEVSELPGAVKGSGIVIDVTVDMLLVRVGRHKKSVAALRPAHSQFIADTVRLFWCYLPGIEGHAYLVTEYVRFLFLLPTRCGLVAGFGKKKFFRYCGRVALIGRDIFAFGFFRVLPIVQAVPDGRCYGFAFACMARQECGCCQIVSLPSKENGGPPEPPPVLRANMARSYVISAKT